MLQACEEQSFAVPFVLPLTFMLVLVLVLMLVLMLVLVLVFGLVVKVPVARKLPPPASMVISPPFVPSALI
jgi:uncharacterized membrane protein